MVPARVLSLTTLLSAVTANPVPLLGLVGTVSSVVGSVPALLQSSCSSDYKKCTLTLSGEIENLLVDGNNWQGKTSVSAWMQQGHAYGSASLAGSAPLPFTITCNAAADVCTGTASGSVTQMFANGQSIQAWGWLTPSGYCKSGVCYGSVTTTGDPAYKE